MLLTVVTGTFSADHQKPYGAERHGHDWHVRAALPAAGHKDAPKQLLDATLSDLNGQFLDNLMSEPTNEGIAEWIGKGIGCAWVYVWRYDAGGEFGGEWRP